MPISTGPEGSEAASGQADTRTVWRRRSVLAGGASALMVAGASAALLLTPRSSGMAIGQPLPPFELGPIEGLPASGFDQEAMRSTAPVVLNAFASWCGPCRSEHPLLMRLAHEHVISVLGMNVQDLPEQAVAFLNELGNPYARVGSDPNRAVANRLGLVGLPHSFALDGEGRLRISRPGPIDARFLDSVLSI